MSDRGNEEEMTGRDPNHATRSALLMCEVDAQGRPSHGQRE